MRNTVLLLAVAGLASAAAAQTGSLSIISSVMTVDTTGATATFTLSVYADADFGTAVAGGGFSLSAVGGAGIVTDMTASVPDWAALGFQDDGHAGDGNYNGVIFGQLIFPPFIPAAAESMLAKGPVLVGTFVVTIPADASGLIEWELGGGVGPFVMEIFTDGGGAGTMTRLTEADIAFGGISVHIFPAPSSVALLGLGGLVLGRRRR